MHAGGVTIVVVRNELQDLRQQGDRPGIEVDASEERGTGFGVSGK